MNKEHLAILKKSYETIALVVGLLQELKVKISVKKVDDGGEFKYAIIGGAEALEWISIDGVDKELGEVLEVLCNGVTFDIGDSMKGFNYNTIHHDVKKLKKIVKWKSVDKMSKTDIVEFGLTTECSAVDKMALEGKVVEMLAKVFERTIYDVVEMLKEYESDHLVKHL